MKIEINTERWKWAAGGKYRIMLNKWFWPCVYPNGYRWTPLIVVQPVKIKDAPKPPDSFTKEEAAAAVRSAKR